MIELRNDALTFRFPDVHPDARLEVSFLRTLRIPDDGKHYPLPPGLGRFPVRHVDDFAQGVPESWLERGGVLLPMYQSEALWLSFSSSFVGGRAQYPFAVKVGAGKINAVNGEDWRSGLSRSGRGTGQGYCVVPGQPWLDGFNVGKGTIRQFVAMPLGSGYSAEEQLTGEATWGGLQIEVFPMKRSAFEERFPKLGESLGMLACPARPLACRAPDMGLAPGGLMKQEIYRDEFSFEDWQGEASARCFVHLANSLVWREITGAEPPPTPVTSKAYTRAGLPWFDYYSDAEALEGSSRLGKLLSVVKKAVEKGDNPLPENESVEPGVVKELGPKRRGDVVRVGKW